MPATPSSPVGPFVEYVGEDLPELLVWRGHPGRVIDAIRPEEADVSPVGGPSMSFPVDLLTSLDEVSYYRQ